MFDVNSKRKNLKNGSYSKKNFNINMRKVLKKLTGKH